MSLINNQYAEDETYCEDGNCVTYVIEIRNFRNKLGKTRVWQSVESDNFFVNWSEFTVRLHIAGDNKDASGHVSLYVTNQSDWMVRSRYKVSVNNELLGSDKPAGRVQDYLGCRGWTKCIPHRRCVKNDLLTSDGVLRIKVRVEVLTEKTPGGVDGRAGHKELILTCLQERLKAMEIQLKVLQEEVVKLRKVNNASEDELKRLQQKTTALEAQLVEVNAKLLKITSDPIINYQLNQL